VPVELRLCLSDSREISGANVTVSRTHTGFSLCFQIISYRNCFEAKQGGLYFQLLVKSRGCHFLRRSTLRGCNLHSTRSQHPDPGGPALPQCPPAPPAAWLHAHLGPAPPAPGDPRGDVVGQVCPDHPGRGAPALCPGPQSGGTHQMEPHEARRPRELRPGRSRSPRGGQSSPPSCQRQLLALFFRGAGLDL